jgi:hypothetical protein
MTQHKARRTNQIAFLPLPATQEVAGSSPVAPAKVLRDSFCDELRDDYAGQAFFLADWTSLHLDIIAQDRGLKRLANSLYEL